MTDFNPLAGAILGSAQAQQLVANEKQRQLRRAQALRKNVASGGDHSEHEVESTEELHPVDDGDKGKDGSKENRREHRGDQEKTQPHIDVKA
jgi:hypothetical protein